MGRGSPSWWDITKVSEEFTYGNSVGVITNDQTLIPTKSRLIIQILKTGGFSDGMVPSVIEKKNPEKFKLRQRMKFPLTDSRCHHKWCALRMYSLPTEKIHRKEPKLPMTLIPSVIAIGKCQISCSESLRLSFGLLGRHLGLGFCVPRFITTLAFILGGM